MILKRFYDDKLAQASYLHCQSGARSAIAASLLESKGFRNVVNRAGGYAAWRAAGNPPERDRPEPRRLH